MVRVVCGGHGDSMPHDVALALACLRKRCPMWHHDRVTEAVSLEQLRAAACREREDHEELVRLVRLANANGIPKTTIAAAIEMNRATVLRYCLGDNQSRP